MGLLPARIEPIIGGVAGAAVDHAISGKGVSIIGAGGGASAASSAAITPQKYQQQKLHHAYSLLLTKNLCSVNSVGASSAEGEGKKKKSVDTCRVAPSPDGNGLYLSPWTKTRPSTAGGAGLWLTLYHPHHHHNGGGGCEIRIYRPLLSAHPVLKMDTPKHRNV